MDSDRHRPAELAGPEQTEVTTRRMLDPIRHHSWNVEEVLAPVKGQRQSAV